MEIFNIHITEFLLIAGIALVVFGPERLPEVGRFLGKQVARFLAWQQQSPELQMINDVRGEFEREIASLRDELVRTRSQLDVSQDVEALRNELRPMLNLRDTSGGSRLSAAADPSPTDAAGGPDGVPSVPAEPVEVPDGVANGAHDAASEAGDAAGRDASLSRLSDAADPDVAVTPPAQPAATAPPRTVATGAPNKLAHSAPTSLLDPPAPPDAAASAELPAGFADADEPRDAELRDQLATIRRDHAMLMEQVQQISGTLHTLMSELHTQKRVHADLAPSAALHEQEGLPT